MVGEVGKAKIAALEEIGEDELFERWALLRRACSRYGAEHRSINGKRSAPASGYGQVDGVEAKRAVRHAAT